MSNSETSHFNNPQYTREWSVIQELEKKNSKCVHDWVYYGHGHNYDVYKCRKCHKEEEY